MNGWMDNSFIMYSLGYLEISNGNMVGFKQRQAMSIRKGKPISFHWELAVFFSVTLATCAFKGPRHFTSTNYTREIIRKRGFNDGLLWTVSNRQ